MSKIMVQKYTDDDGDKNGVTLLVYEAYPNFAAPRSGCALAGAAQDCSHVWNDFGQLGGRNVSWCPRCDTQAWTGKEPVAAVAPSDAKDAEPVISSYDIEKVKKLKCQFVDSLIHSGIQYRTCGAISATLNRIIDDSEAAAMAAAPSSAAGKEGGSK